MSMEKNKFVTRSSIILPVVKLRNRTWRSNRRGRGKGQN